MASYNDITTLVTPGGTITHNAAGGVATFQVDPSRCTGFGMGKVRASISNKGQTSGYILHDFFEEGSHLIVAGVIANATTTERNTMQSQLDAALRSILTTTGTLNVGAAALTVKCDVESSYPHWSANVKGFVYGLVTATAVTL